MTVGLSPQAIKALTDFAAFPLAGQRGVLGVTSLVQPVIDANKLTNPYVDDETRHYAKYKTLIKVIVTTLSGVSVRLIGQVIGANLVRSGRLPIPEVVKDKFSHNALSLINQASSKEIPVISEIMSKYEAIKHLPGSQRAKPLELLISQIKGLVKPEIVKSAAKETFKTPEGTIQFFTSNLFRGNVTDKKVLDALKNLDNVDDIAKIVSPRLSKEGKQILSKANIKNGLDLFKHLTNNISSSRYIRGAALGLGLIGAFTSVFALDIPFVNKFLNYAMSKIKSDNAKPSETPFPIPPVFEQFESSITVQAIKKGGIHV